MKKLLLLLVIPFLSFGQSYSTYYGTSNINANVNSNINANINKNVNVSGNVNKTIKTIDYGALANANAQRERNRIESLKMQNEKDYQAMIEIASDPSKAYDYGRNNNYEATSRYFWNENSDTRGFRKFTWRHRKPHKSLFDRTNSGEAHRYGYTYDNISDDGIITTMVIGTKRKVEYIVKNPKLFNAVENKLRLLEIVLRAQDLGSVITGNTTITNKKKVNIKSSELEKVLEFADIEVGKEVGPNKYGIKGFIHKKDLNRATVYGLEGFVATIISEDKYDISITDFYYAVSQNGEIIADSKAVFRGDKDEVGFEELEGRRYYFRKLIRRTISSAQLLDVKY